MFKIYIFFFLFFLSAITAQTKENDSEPKFYENKGQIVDQNGKKNPDVLFLFNSNGLNVQLKKSGFSYDFYEVEKTEKKVNNYQNSSSPQNLSETEKFDYKSIYHRIDIELLNSNLNAIIVGEGKSTYFENYYQTKQNGEIINVKDVHLYKKITYKNIYPKIDLEFEGNLNSKTPIKYNFIVKPGGNISDIKLKIYGGANNLENNEISITTKFGEVVEKIPASWIKGNENNIIPVNFISLGDSVYGLSISKPYDGSKTLIIDPVPVRIWGSFFGGNGEDQIKVKTDSQNFVYVNGATTSTNNIATSGAYQSTIAGNSDAIISKITENGQKLWATYYGNSFNDAAIDVNFDLSFNVYVTGFTRIPLSSTGINYNQEAFVLKLNSNGILVFNNLFGGNQSETANTIFVDNNSFYIAGETRSTNLPAVNTYQTIKISTGGFSDGFIAKYDLNGNFIWTSYLGGSNGATAFNKIMNIENNSLDIIANTTSSQIPMVNPIQANNAGNPGVTDILYIKLSADGTQLLRSSYFGTPGQDYTFEARIVNGVLIIPGTFQQNGGNANSVGIYRANLTTNAITKSYFPTLNTFQNQFYVDGNGDVLHTGLSTSSGPPNIATPNAYMPTMGQSIKSYLIKFDENDIKIWGTYYGGNGSTQSSNVTKDSSGYIYMSGLSSSNTSGIATPGTFQQTQGSGNDGYIVKFQDCDSLGSIGSNAPLCTGNNLNLTASGGDSYAWTGPNGFTSTLQNPTIPNANSTNSGTYFCLITSNSGCSGTQSMNVTVGNTGFPIPVIANLPDITGNCQTIINTIPTANTNCSGIISATTTDPLNYSQPGNYVIHWTYNDGNGNTIAQNQNVIITAEVPPTAASSQSFCLINQPKLSNIAITGSNIKWYDASGNILPANTFLVNGTTYSATQTVNGCESLSIPINVIIENPNPPTGNATQTFCPTENPTLASLSVNGQNIKWYNAAGTLLPITTSLINGQTYYATQTINGCESNQNLAVNVVISNDVVPANNYSTSFCNPSIGNTSVINLSSYNGNIIANPINYIFEYYDQANQLILNFSNVNLAIGINQFKVKVLNSNGCYKMVNLIITLLPKPEINVSNVEFCKGTRAILDAGSGFTTYLWSTGETTQIINVTQPGIYTVTVTNASGCSNSAQLNVTETVAGTITGIEIYNNTATVNVSPSGNYLYSLDGINWQNSNIFYNLSNGTFTVFVKTNSGCEIKSFDFTIFNIQNVITPNNDGSNDFWIIEGLKNYKNSQVSVFDRFGKIVFDKKDATEIKWDGTYLSQPLPTNNYWYILKVSDGRVYTGFLLIKNRE